MEPETQICTGQKLTAIQWIWSCIVLVSLFVANETTAWNARYFQYTEKSVYDQNEFRTPVDGRNWTAYYNPTYSGPDHDPPSSFTSSTIDDCHRFCKTNPYPYDNTEHCVSLGCELMFATSQLPSVVIPVFKGHNWLTNYAIWLLKEYNLCPANISDEEIKYIHYGVNFADHPWMGRPDAKEANKDYVIGIWDLEENNLRKKVFDRDDYLWDRFIVEFRFRGGTFKDAGYKNRVNLYASTRHKAKIVDVNEIVAADNFFHFPLKDSVKRKSKAVILRSDNAFDKSRVFHNSDVNAMMYASILYQLARKFWPGNTNLEPDILDLVKISSHKGPGKLETGAVVIDHFPGAAEYIERAYLPATYLGGNPFICAPGFRKPPSRKYDLCRWGRPSWPIWVPDTKEQCFENTCSKKLSTECLSNRRCVEIFHQNLVTRKPGRSRRNALIYLGWALHIAQDLAMPHHAANWVGKDHSRIELLADQIIKLGFGDRPLGKGGWADWSRFEKEIDKTFGTFTGRQEICKKLRLYGKNTMDDESLKVFFDGIRNDAYIDRRKIGKRGDTRKKYIQLAFQRAILASMKLITCMER